MKLRRKSPSAEAVQWDGSRSTLERLVAAGMLVKRTDHHRDTPDRIDYLAIVVNVADSAVTSAIQVHGGSWIVVESSPHYRGTRWFVFATPDDLLAVYEVAP